LSDFSDDAGTRAKFRILATDPLTRLERLAFSNCDWLYLVGTCVFAVGFGFGLARMPGDVPVPTVAVVGPIVAAIALGWPSSIRSNLYLPLVRTRVAMGTCGVCGSELPRDRADARGLVACRKCAARWKLTKSPAASAREELDFQRNRRNAGWLLLDPAAAAGGKEPLLPRARAVVRFVDRETSESQRAFVRLAAVSIAIFVPLMWARSPLGVPFFYIAAVSVLCASPHGRRHVPRTTQSLLLKCALCPKCGRDLPIASVAGSDGRGSIACEGCDCSWPEHQVLRYPIPEDRCPACDTDREGAERCASCELHEAARGRELADKTPFCARCGGVLPGSDRVCPRCGVMAGTTYA
jgi:hypothetical protein